MEAAFYTLDGTGRAVCGLCPHRCRIEKGHYGRCQTRYFDGTTLSALNYGKVTAIALDPIEKKPLYHFHGGAAILSLGSWGCNFTCPFCQNWQISQQPASSRDLTPEEVVALAEKYVPQGNIGLAYTYNEPTLSYEFILQTARLMKERGLFNVMVSNGYIEKGPLQALLPYIDAWNIDLKGFSEDFYRSQCGASLKPVLETITAAAAASHVEVTTLIIPGKNDDEEPTDGEARWLAAIDETMPLHLTRYFPRYRDTTPMTPIDTLQRLAVTAGKYLRHVYIGNV